MSELMKTDGKTPQTEIAATEYKNDHITVHVQQYPGCRVKMEIAVTPTASLAAYKKAMKSINKEVSVPGFRKGKAPEAMLIQNYGTYIDREWNEVLLQTAFHEALTLSKLYPLNENSVKKPHVKNASRDKGAEITIEFECSPSIPEIAADTITLKAVKKKEVDQKQIEHALQDIRLHHGEWIDVTDRPVQEGDYIDVDIEDLNQPNFYICKNTRFEVADGKMGDWMRKLVIQKNVNDVVEGMSERTPDIDADTEFKPTRCKITIKVIKTAVPAEINDELAKKLGVENIEQMNERITLSLQREAEETAQQKLRDQLRKILIEQYTFEVPSTLIQSELKSRLTLLKKNLDKSGKLAAQITEDLDAAKAPMEKAIKEDFQIFFISRNIADKNNIHITQDELFKELMQQMYSPTSSIDTSLDPEEARSKIYINLLTQKIEDFLIKQAKIQ